MSRSSASLSDFFHCSFCLFGNGNSQKWFCNSPWDTVGPKSVGSFLLFRSLPEKMQIRPFLCAMSLPLAFISIAFIFLNDLLVDKYMNYCSYVILETVPIKSYADEMFLVVKTTAKVGFSVACG